MPDAKTIDLHHLSNDVYRAIRQGWYRHEHADGRNPTFRVLGTGTYHHPDISWEGAKGLSEAYGVYLPHAILVDKIMHDDLMEEIPEQHMHDWLDSIESNVRINTLWYRKEAKGRTYWDPNSRLPASVPHTGLKLTQRLLQARLITEVTPEQAARLQLEREIAAQQSRLRSAPEIIQDAATAATKCKL